MSVIFLDTSAYAKRYRQETGAAWIRSICRTESIILSILVIAEFSSIVARLRREGVLTQPRLAGMMRRFEADLARCLLIGIDRSIVDESSTLLLTCPPSIPLRSLDAIQLA